MFLLISVPISVFTALYRHNYNQAIKYEISNKYETSLEKVNYILDRMMQSVGRNGLILANDKEVRKFMFAKKVNDYTYDHKQISAMFETIKNSDEAIDSIYIFSEKTGYIFTDTTGNYKNNFFDVDWLTEYEQRKNEGQWFLKRSFFSAQANQNKQYLSVFQNIRFYNDTYGTVVINIDIDFLKNNYLSTTNNTSWAIYDADNSLIVSAGEMELKPFVIQEESTDSKPISKTIKDNGKERVVSVIRSSYTDWQVMVGNANVFLKKNTHYLEILNILLILYSIVIIIIIFGWVIKPMLRILSTLKTCSDNMLDNFIKGNSEDEVDFIIKNVAETLEKFNLMEKESKVRLKNLQAAQFAALQAQINPHFIGNTLYGLYWLSLEKIGGANEVSNAISTLSELVYLTTSQKGYFWEVENELKHLEKFIKIQRFRFGKDIFVELNVDSSITHFKMIRLILQPIVENAFEHGLSSVKDGVIRISGEIINDDIVFKVFDNGKGMSEESVQSIRYVETDECGHKHGLKNVNYRIKLLFGDSYGVEVETPETGGTTVIIRLPKI